MKSPSRQKPGATLSGSSFRDPAGFIFKNRRGEILRQINDVGQADYAALMQSGLYGTLTKRQLLVEHTDTHHSQAAFSQAIAIIKPEPIPFISYPFEWSFSQLRDAALLTLHIQQLALKHGMSLKDASAYNVQFHNGKPIFIDTLSFEIYKLGKAWQAYRQFCQHFIAPLALMAYTDLSLSQLLRVHIDGIPLNLAAKLLPRSAKIKPGVALHIVLHGRAQKAKATEHKMSTRTVSQTNLEAILSSLERTVRAMKPPKTATEWGDYYNKTNYTVSAADQKAAIVVNLVKSVGAKTSLDIGGNDGRYSRALHPLGIFTVCSDIDPNAVEANYRLTKLHKEAQMLPLLIDLTNPGGALGWANAEREPIHERLQCDVVLALALIHHLAISNNLPLSHIAEYLKQFGTYLILEFVPKKDSQVQKLLSTRKDIFPSYTEAGLKQAFSERYQLVKEVGIAGTKRTLYLFKRI